MYNEVMKKTDSLGADIVLDLDSKVIKWWRKPRILFGRKENTFAPPLLVP